MVTLHILIINCIFNNRDTVVLGEHLFQYLAQFFPSREKALFILDSACIKTWFKCFDFIDLLKLSNGFLSKINIQFRKQNKPITVCRFICIIERYQIIHLVAQTEAKPFFFTLIITFSFMFLWLSTINTGIKREEEKAREMLANFEIIRNKSIKQKKYYYFICLSHLYFFMHLFEDK